MQKQMAAVSLDKQDVQQASHLHVQLQKALQDQQALSSRLQEEWHHQEHKLSIRYSSALVSWSIPCGLFARGNCGGQNAGKHSMGSHHNSSRLHCEVCQQQTLQFMIVAEATSSAVFQDCLSCAFARQ